MNTMAIVILVLILVLLVVLCLGLGLVIMRQEKLEKRMSREREISAVSLDTIRNISRKMDTVQNQSALSLQSANSLQDQVHSITQVMTNAKRRGSWGEYQLESLIRTYLGDNDRIYSVQYHLKNGRISDGAFHLPDTDKVLCIDSKFPMENYIRMNEENGDEEYYERELRKNVKKHIQDVAGKYITEETLDEAILFIPNEGVFAWLCGPGSDLMEFAMASHVMLVSPTTLGGVVFNLLASTKNFWRIQNLDQIEKQIETLELQAEALVSQCQKVRKTEQLLDKQSAELSKACYRLLYQLDALSNPDGDISVPASEKGQGQTFEDYTSGRPDQSGKILP